MYYNNLKIIQSNNVKLIQDVPNSDYYITLHEVKVYINNSNYFKIPVGFKTDGASIPLQVQSIYYKPLDDAVLIAGLVHDFVFLQHTSDHNYDKNEYDFDKTNNTVKLQLYNSITNNKSKKLILSNNDATQLYSDFVNKYAPDEYINCRLFKINLKSKKITAGKVFLGTFSAYKWSNERSTYMFKNIKKTILDLDLKNYKAKVEINNPYFDKCIITDNQPVPIPSSKQCSIM